MSQLSLWLSRPNQSSLRFRFGDRLIVASPSKFPLFQTCIHHLQSFLWFKRDVMASIYAQFHVNSAHWEHRVVRLPHAKAIETQVGWDLNDWSNQAKYCFCFDGNRHVRTQLEYQQTRERRQEEFEASETIRNAIKHYLPFKIRTICTRNSNRTSRHLDGHTNTKTSFYYLHGQTRETDGNQHQITHHGIMYSLIRIKCTIVLSPTAQSRLVILRIHFETLWI